MHWLATPIYFWVLFSSLITFTADTPMLIRWYFLPLLIDCHFDGHFATPIDGQLRHYAAIFSFSAYGSWLSRRQPNGQLSPLSPFRWAATLSGFEFHADILRLRHAFDATPADFRHYAIARCRDAEATPAMATPYFRWAFMLSDRLSARHCRRITPLIRPRFAATGGMAGIAISAEMSASISKASWRHTPIFQPAAVISSFTPRLPHTRGWLPTRLPQPFLSASKFLQYYFIDTLIALLLSIATLLATVLHILSVCRHWALLSFHYCRRIATDKIHWQPASDRQAGSRFRIAISFTAFKYWDIFTLYRYAIDNSRHFSATPPIRHL